MKQILIDKFIVPENAFEEFTRRMNYNRSFISKLQGFVNDAAYRRSDEEGNTVVVTVAVWESEDAFTRAKHAVQAEYAKTGFNLPEVLSQLNIKAERGTYTEVTS